MPKKKSESPFLPGFAPIAEVKPIKPKGFTSESGRKAAQKLHNSRTPEQRREIAQRAARARWEKEKEKALKGSRLSTPQKQKPLTAPFQQDSIKPKSVQKSTKGVYHYETDENGKRHRVAGKRPQKYHYETDESGKRHRVAGERKKPNKGKTPPKKPALRSKTDRLQIRDDDYYKTLQRIEGRINPVARPVFKDFENKTLKELKKASKAVIDRAEKKVKALEKFEKETGITPPTLRELRRNIPETNGHLRSGGNDANKIKKAWANAVSVLNNPKARAEYARSNVDRLEKMTGLTDPKLQSLMFKYGNELQQLQGKSQYSSEQLITGMQEMIDALDEMGLSDVGFEIDAQAIENAFNTVVKSMTTVRDILHDDFWDD